jgi:RNA polymerase sigma factor (sigma-70 family)
MLRVRQGQISELGILFERYKKSLFNYFYRNTYDHTLSEDLVQNVFVRILKYRNHFKGEGKFSSRMYHIAHNTLYDEKYRGSKLHNTVCIDDVPPVSEHDQERLFDNRQEVNMLQKALSKLDHAQREILTLSKFQNLKYRQIAEILHCSESAVKVRIFRAMIKLRDIYHELEG